MRILVVDDDEDTTALLSLLLEREGWRVDAVASLHAANSALREQTYAVLITDLHLPDGSGMSLLAESPRPVPIALVVTGVDDERQRKACLELGFDRCLTKPMSGSEIVATIRTLLHARAERT